jgi:hypothetical protein
MIFFLIVVGLKGYFSHFHSYMNFFFYSYMNFFFFNIYMKDLFIYLYNYMIFLIVIGLRDILVILLMLGYYMLYIRVLLEFIIKNCNNS